MSNKKTVRINPNGLFVSRGGQARTDDPLLPKQVRYQLRYTPIVYCMVRVRYSAVADATLQIIPILVKNENRLLLNRAANVNIILQ